MKRPIVKPIPSAPAYGADSNGEIVRIKPGCGTRVGRVLKTGLTKEGYRRPWVRLSDGNPKKVMQHRLVCEAWHGPPPSPSHQAAHENGIRHDNRPENLSWKTALENTEDTIRHGTRLRGEKNLQAKLKTLDVLMLRQQLRTGKLNSIREAKRHGCDRKTITDAARGRTWAWLPLKRPTRKSKKSGGQP